MFGKSRATNTCHKCTNRQILRGVHGNTRRCCGNKLRRPYGTDTIIREQTLSDAERDAWHQHWQEVLREQVAQATHMAETLDFAVTKLIQVSPSSASSASFFSFSFSCRLLAFLYRSVGARARGCMCGSTCAQYTCGL
jgi:hypothetical protein